MSNGNMSNIKNKANNFPAVIEEFTARTLVEFEKLMSYPVLLPAAALGQNCIWNTPFSRIVNLLMRSGIPSDHLQVSLLALLTLNSAHLGYPIALELVDDSHAGAIEIINACTSMTPPSFLLHWSQAFTSDALFREKDRIAGRTIVGLDSGEFKKAKGIFNLLLKNQSYSFDATLPSKHGAIHYNAEINGPVACLLAAKDPKQLILADPSFLRHHVRPSLQTASFVTGLSRRERAILDLSLNTIKAGLARLHPQDVRIPYHRQLTEHWQKNEVAPGKIATFLQMIKVIAIINNSPPMNHVEYFSHFTDTDPKTVSLAFGCEAGLPRELMAKKLDYYIFWKIISGLLANEDVHVTERQKRIFNVIKGHNKNALLNTTMMSPGASIYEQLNLLAVEDSPCWATQDAIFKEINRDSGSAIGNTNILYKELQQLVDKGVIQRKKYARTNRVGYHVTTWKITDTIRLPHPSEIKFPETDQSRRHIIDPLTGQTDTV